jgi:hypothetical protein
MALVDSTAEFVLRVAQLGLKEHEARFVEAGVTTFAQLAFFSGYSPAARLPHRADQAAVARLPRRVLGVPRSVRGPPLGRLPLLRADMLRH